MVSDEPRVRAWWSKTTLARIRAQPEAAVLLKAIGSDLLTLVDRSERLEFIPMSQHAALCDRVIAQVGSASFVAILSTREADPIAAVNMQARLGIIGEDPLLLMRHTAHTWSDIALDAGTLVVTSEGRHNAVLTFEQLPLVAMRAWFKLSFEALIRRALRASDAQGKIEASSSAALRTLSLRVTW